MQISQAKQEELGLIITGLRAIYCADCEPVRVKLLAQMETELSTRFGARILTDDERDQKRRAAYAA